MQKTSDLTNVKEVPARLNHNVVQVSIANAEQIGQDTVAGT